MATVDHEAARIFDALIGDGDDDLGIGAVRLSDIEPERVEWLWPGRIPFGKLTILEGDPKVGKSTMGTDIAGRVSTGSPFPDGHRPAPGSVILMTAEDGLADTVRPRLDAACADSTRVIAWESVEVVDEEGMPAGIRPPSLPRDLNELERLIVATGAVLVIVDVLAAYLGADVDGHRDQDVRRALMPLAKLAERTGAAIFVLRHLNKAGGANALYRGGGSIGIAGAARSILLAAVDPDDDSGSRRVLAVTASNLAAPVPALAYHLVPAEEHGCARIVWDGVSEHTSTSLLTLPAGEEERSAVDEARAFLIDLLTDGPVPATEVARRARDAAVPMRTLHRAKAALRVKSVRTGTAWSWTMPANIATTPQVPGLGNVGNLGNLDVDQGVSDPQPCQEDQDCQPQGLAAFDLSEDEF